ncbi:hypothetical protein U9M48_021022 [Paspalum notatum var. saurae]|uniref:Uncharacterized protein n=1 Tax=Paspalum notatum var. saurae TaxID=547442 RepID=A0AAQ3TGR4_PASNO
MHACRDLSRLRRTPAPRRRAPAGRVWPPPCLAAAPPLPACRRGRPPHAVAVAAAAARPAASSRRHTPAAPRLRDPTASGPHRRRTPAMPPRRDAAATGKGRDRGASVAAAAPERRPPRPLPSRWCRAKTPPPWGREGRKGALVSTPPRPGRPRLVDALTPLRPGYAAPTLHARRDAAPCRRTETPPPPRRCAAHPGCWCRHRAGAPPTLAAGAAAPSSLTLGPRAPPRVACVLHAAVPGPSRRHAWLGRKRRVKGRGERKRERNGGRR